MRGWKRARKAKEISEVKGVERDSNSLDDRFQEPTIVSVFGFEIYIEQAGELGIIDGFKIEKGPGWGFFKNSNAR